MRNLLIVTLLLVGCADLTRPSGALPASSVALPPPEKKAPVVTGSVAAPDGAMKPTVAAPVPGCGG